jgi:hypothetical protein
MRKEPGRRPIFVGIGAVLSGLLSAWLLSPDPANGQQAMNDPPHLQLTDTVTRHGITWQFTEKAKVGQFVNGDFYVVGAAIVASITPKPENGRNGSVLNLPLDQGRSGFDERVAGGRWDPKLGVQVPISMKLRDILLSSISVEKMGDLPCPLRPADKALSPVRSVSVLTCVAEPLPPDAFRPSYCDCQEQKIYLARHLRRTLLPRLPRVGIPFELENGTRFTCADWADRFERPWLDVCFFGFDAASENQPQYGREVGRAAGIASLLLCLDFPPQEKERLLINFVQHGIDLWGIVRAGYPGWQAHGGHGSGRKWPIVFAGLLLGDEDMQSPAKKYPNVRFGEDMQTMYGKGWTGATALYAGHVGQTGLAGQVGWGAYEHLPPAEWPAQIGEDYRRCCTSIAWVGQALAARILHAEKAWNHDAFFDYVDRWMTEDDTPHIAEIKQAKGWDYSAPWERQRQAWDPFVDTLWAKYRNPPPLASGPASSAPRP